MWPEKKNKTQQQFRLKQYKNQVFACNEKGGPWGPVGGIAPFYTVSLKPFGTRPQCPDDAATETMRRKKLKE